METAAIHKIHFENRCIIICGTDCPSLSDPNCVEFHPSEDMGIPSLVQMMETTSTLMKVYIPCDDPEAMYRKLCSQFYEVNAAGGLVRNRRGDYLLISRNGKWDLPKGHQEQGEDIRITAVREVQEETGVDQLQLEDLICITDHCYFRAGKWHLKHTWWYEMLYTDPVNLVPQTEEDITKAAWVAKSSLPPYLKNTYPSIAEVFRMDHI